MPHHAPRRGAGFVTTSVRDESVGNRTRIIVPDDRVLYAEVKDTI
jgi:hypothetical protein